MTSRLYKSTICVRVFPGMAPCGVTCANFAMVTPHGAIPGKTRVQNVDCYNLDVIISVGYRVHSPRGVEFRRWATRVLKEYIVRGYALNRERLKQLGQAA